MHTWVFQTCTSGPGSGAVGTYLRLTSKNNTKPIISINFKNINEIITCCSISKAKQDLILQEIKSGQVSK